MGNTTACCYSPGGMGCNRDQQPMYFLKVPCMSYVLTDNRCCGTGDIARDLNWVHRKGRLERLEWLDQRWFRPADWHFWDGEAWTFMGIQWNIMDNLWMDVSFIFKHQISLEGRKLQTAEAPGPVDPLRDEANFEKVCRLGMVAMAETV